MGRDFCDGCNARITIAGGISNIWTTDSVHTQGITIELDDGSDHLLCYECIEQLPDNPSRSDIAEL
jgi:hypothetical protein